MVYIPNHNNKKKMSVLMRAKRKRALLMGLNYTLDPNARLAGCCNDAREMAKYLQASCGFTPAQVEVVVDDGVRNVASLRKLTHDGMIAALQALCMASWREQLELVMFHYSGHGSQVRDSSGDETDARDEGLVPTDYRSKGLILDDVLQRIFLQFNPRTKLVCFFDCCHSGSVLDLPFAYDAKLRRDPGTRLVSLPPNCPRVVCISGCRDDQVSMDASDPLTRAPAGAMTSALLKVLRVHGSSAVTYPVLQLQDDLKKELVARGFVQVPLLSTSILTSAAEPWM